MARTLLGTQCASVRGAISKYSLYGLPGLADGSSDLGVCSVVGKRSAPELRPHPSQTIRIQHGALGTPEKASDPAPEPGHQEGFLEEVALDEA